MSHSAYEWDVVLDDIIEMVKSKPDSILEKRHDGSTIFHIVAENSNQLDGRILAFLIKSNKRGLQIANNFGLLPIHKAVMHHDTDIDELDMLISSHPEGLMHQSIEGQTPLHLAVTGSKASIQSVTFILSNVEYGLKSAVVEDRYGHLPLHKAVSRNNPSESVIDELLDSCPSACKHPDRNGLLPLHWAVSRSKPNISVIKKLLLKYPEAATLKDSSGRLPIDCFLYIDPRTRAERVLRKVPSASYKEREELTYMLLCVDDFVADVRKEEDEAEDGRLDLEVDVDD